MKSFDLIKIMLETNNDLLSLIVNNLISIGETKGNELKTLPVSGSLSELIPPFISLEDREKIDKIVVNILTLIGSGDEDCIDSIKGYNQTLNNIIKSYPLYQKVELPEGTKRLLDTIWERLSSDSIWSSIIISFTNTLHLIYIFAS